MANAARALLWFVLAILHGRPNAEEHCVKEIGCCFKPSQQSPTTMDCDLKGRQINFTEVNLLPSLQDIRVANASTINVHENAIRKLAKLRKLQFVGVGELTLFSRSMTTQSGTISMTVEKVTLLSLHLWAFAGWNNTGSQLTMRNIETAIIARTFTPNSLFQSVLLENIGSLKVLSKLTSGVIIRELILKNVTLKTCFYGTFGGRITSMTWQSVKVDSIKEGCVQATADWKRLTVQSSSLDHVPPSSFQGTVQNVLIEDSRISSVATAGFDLSVSNFSIKSCSIGNLSAGALTVYVSKSMSLIDINVTTLRENAFGSVRTNEDAGQPVSVQRLSVGKAESGSLRFRGEVGVTLKEISVGDPFACDAQALARHLVLGDSDEPGELQKQKQMALLKQAAHELRSVNSSSSGNSSGATWSWSRCLGCHDGTTVCPDESKTQSWIPYAGAAAALLLVVVVAAYLLAAGHRGLARRRHGHVATKLADNKDPPTTAVEGQSLALAERGGRHFVKGTSRMGKARPSGQGSGATAARPKKDSCEGYSGGYSEDYCEAMTPPAGRAPKVESNDYTEVSPTATRNDPQPPGRQLPPDTEQHIYEEIPELTLPSTERSKQLKTDAVAVLPVYAEPIKNQSISGPAEPGLQGGLCPGTTLYAISSGELPSSDPMNPPQTRPGDESAEYAEISIHTSEDKTKEVDGRADGLVENTLYGTMM